MASTLLVAAILLVASGDPLWGRGLLYVAALAIGQLAMAWTVALSSQATVPDSRAVGIPVPAAGPPSIEPAGTPGPSGPPGRPGAGADRPGEEGLRERGERDRRRAARLWLPSAMGPAAGGLLAGLAHRWGWLPPLAPATAFLGLAAFGAALVLRLWAATARGPATGAAGGGTATGSAAAPTGPYRLVRHPVTLAAIVADVAVPLVLGSPWAFAAVLPAAALLAARAGLEDRALRAIGTDYREYQRRVRWHLLPGVW